MRLEYDKDGYLFIVNFSVSDIKSNSEGKFVSYKDQSGFHERKFGKYSEHMRFVNWLIEHNA